MRVMQLEIIRVALNKAKSRLAKCNYRFEVRATASNMGC